MFTSNYCPFFYISTLLRYLINPFDILKNLSFGTRNLFPKFNPPITRDTLDPIATFDLVDE